MSETNPTLASPVSPAARPARGLLGTLASFLRWRFGQCLLLVVLGAVVRLPALQGELIYDDSFLAQENPFVKSPIFAAEVFRHHLMLDSLSSHYRPVQNISYMFDYFFWNEDMYGYHLTNLLLHLASGLLLFFLLRKLLPTLARVSASGHQRAFSALGAFLPFFLALLWIVHPVHSAAVDYISGRADSLAFVFSCGAWLLYLQARHARSEWARWSFAAFAAVSLLLGLCSRESACMWLLIFLLHLFCFEKALRLRWKFLVVAASLAVVVAYAGLRHLPEKRSSEQPSNGWSRPVQAVLMLRALGDYGRLMFYPANLHMERTVVNAEAARGHANWRGAIGSDYLTVFGLIVAAAFVWGASFRGRARGLRAFGAAWFILTYLPISNLIELNATVAEHWLYLPSVGFLIFLGGCFLELPPRFQRAATAFACVAVAALGARSYVRSTDWVSAETFYKRTGEAGGGSVRIVLNLGQIYSTRGDYAAAERLYRKALELCPTYFIARNNLAHALRKQGKTEEAERIAVAASADAPEARKEYPRTWVIALNLATMRAEENKPAAAIEILAAARRDYPNAWHLYALESELVRKENGPAAAIPIIEQFTRRNWWHLEGQVALGKLLFEKGDYAAAETVFRRASRLDVHDASALNMLALLDVTRERFDTAYRTQRRAIARQPDEPRQYLILSDILTKMGRRDEAQAVIAQVSRMQDMARAAVAN